MDRESAVVLLQSNPATNRNALRLWRFIPC